MLVKIDTTVGATDPRARAINFMRAIEAVATAAAGSTPSVTPVSAPSTNASGDVITQVISNTEAGGWTSSSSSNVSVAYSSTSATPYILDLYNSLPGDTGKTVYPYNKITFFTNRLKMFSSTYWQTNTGTVLAAYGDNSYNDAQVLDVIAGFHTATTYDGNYASPPVPTGSTSSGIAFATAMARTSWYLSNPYYFTSYSTGSASRLSVNYGEYLIASTSQYLIVMNRYVMMYIGTRESTAWETNFADNPLFAAFCLDASNPVVGTTSARFDNMVSWMYVTDASGGVSGPSWKHSMAYGQTINPVSGYVNSSVTNATFWGQTVSNGGSVMSYGGGYVGPLMPYGLRCHTYASTIGPTTDTTGALVPPAYPLNFNYGYGGNEINFTGKLKGIFRSLSGSDTYMNNYYADGQTFTVAGDSYYPYAIGDDTLARDLFLIRKA